MATDLSAKIGVKALVSWEALSSSVVGNVLAGNRHISTCITIGQGEPWTRSLTGKGMRPWLRVCT